MSQPACLFAWLVRHTFASMPFTHTLAVRFRDLDLFGHVNNAVYLTYLEEARIAFMTHTGIRNWQDRSRSTIVAHIDIDYRAPAKLGDTLELVLTVSRIGNRSFSLHYEVTQIDTRTRIAEANSVQVCYDFEADHVIALPEAWLASLKFHQAIS